ncbi:hypothetical protein ACFWN2_17465 [Lentzea sp. NPDC058436]|uniref:hypothetical protein n=1 Tax=Lentzea sp. NPDC058436 TaxID=3346499 RepID=UPI003649CFE4
MTSMLPPTRDLPPGRHARIRADVERAVAGRRRLLFPVLAGVAAVAAVVASVLTLQPEPPPPSPAVHVTSAAPTTTSDGFGVPQETVEAIEKGCMESTGLIGTAKLHQLFDEQTRWAVLYTGEEALLCGLGERGKEYNAGFGRRAVNVLPGHFSVDTATATAGGDHFGPGHEGRPGHRTTVGRVDSKVAKVTVTADDMTVEAKIANGTFAVRVYHPPSWSISGAGPDPVVRAYDASGDLLGTSTEQLGACFYDPATLAIVYGDQNRAKDQCRAASPWK